MTKRYKIKELGRVVEVTEAELRRGKRNPEYHDLDAEPCYLCGRDTILYCNDCGEPVCNRCIYPNMVCGDCQEL